MASLSFVSKVIDANQNLKLSGRQAGVGNFPTLGLYPQAPNEGKIQTRLLGKKPLYFGSGAR
jgi:hypothetical protein